MNKKLLGLMALTAALAACTEKEMILEETETPQEISFTTFANSITRAENSTETSNLGLAKHHTTFQVWANKDNGSDTVKVYVGDTVTYDGSSKVWKPSLKKYWDKAAARYFFFAAAPKDKKWTVEFNETDSLSFKYNDFKLTGINLAKVLGDTTRVKPDTTWLNQADVDLLIASGKVVANDAYNKAAPEKVTLDFNHILSRLNILVKKGIDEKVTLDSVVVYNLKNQGDFAEYKADIKSDSLAKGTTGRWSDLQTSGTYKLTSVIMDSVLKDPAKYVLESLIIPQEITYESINVNGKDSETQAYIYVYYKIAGEPYSGAYNLAAAFQATSLATQFPLNEGWQYNLTLCIGDASNPDANTIAFDANVYEWATGSSKELKVD